MRIPLRYAVLCSLLLISASCGSVSVLRRPATAKLINRGGRTVGQIVMLQARNGLRTRLRLSGLEPGQYALQVHQKGICDPPNFESAGAVLRMTSTHGADALEFRVDALGSANLRSTLRGSALPTAGRTCWERRW